MCGQNMAMATATRESYTTTVELIIPHIQHGRGKITNATSQGKQRPRVR
jgi:hypothetical protein